MLSSLAIILTSLYCAESSIIIFPEICKRYNSLSGSVVGSDCPVRESYNSYLSHACPSPPPLSGSSLLIVHCLQCVFHTLSDNLRCFCT
nr:MAG TPA: hypothetical protein [Caudoviricetes sp.]